MHKKGDYETKKIEYKSTVRDDDKILSTSYNNVMSDKEQIESFNKLLQSQKNTYEQVGSSKNKNDWNVKEYHNSSLNKEYMDPYAKHTFQQYICANAPFTQIDY